MIVLMMSWIKASTRFHLDGEDDDDDDDNDDRFGDDNVGKNWNIIEIISLLFVGPGRCEGLDGRTCQELFKCQATQILN